MTQEQIERTMEFILNQQASTSVKLDMLAERQAEGEKRVEQLERTTQRAIKLGTRFIVGLGRSHKDLREMQKKHEENQKKHEENLTRIEDNLNALILLFERHVTETHGTI